MRILVTLAGLKSAKIRPEAKIQTSFKIHEYQWLLFDISRVTAYSGAKNEVAYAYERVEAFRKYFGRVIVHFDKNKRNYIRDAVTVINDCTVVQVLESKFDDDIFPGYDKVLLKWSDLKRVLPKSAWRTALGNQKAIYLITDTSNGKQYVGSASGDEMLLQRWRSYVKTGNGGNEGLKPLSFSHIQEKFQYSILDIFKSTTSKENIQKRESWWKKVLNSKSPHGYNHN